MKKTHPSLIERYTKMSGDTKIRVGLSLSETVRKVRRDGVIDTKKVYGNRSRLTS